MSSPSILETIVAKRREDVAEAKAAVPAGELQRAASAAPPPIDFVARLAEGPPAVIAEIKRASPSKGDIAPRMDAAEQALRYARGGAAGISVLTEPAWFKGTLDDLRGAREAVEALGAERPGLLRKDFLIDEYQLLEARAHGADAVLLIVACLDDEALGRLLACSRELGMEAMVEVNSAEEMERAGAVGARLVGINNRDLRSFDVDLGTTDRLVGGAPEAALLAALSGISTREDVARFEEVGATAVLVGEALMRAEDPAAMIAELRGR
ncbi:MAG: indole-3-glycerol phosphate synthase TrpC [Chloroflexota bacterium]|nr:indole-3-glycerol phosphate synthase TrpC [Chloroflexota bacterium]